MPVAADLADRDFLDPFRIGALLERRDQLVHVEAGRQVLLDHLVDQDRPSREVDPQLQLLRGRPHAARPARVEPMISANFHRNVSWSFLQTRRTSAAGRFPQASSRSSPTRQQPEASYRPTASTPYPNADAGDSGRDREAADQADSADLVRRRSSTRATLALRERELHPRSSSTRSTTLSCLASTEITVP